MRISPASNRHAPDAIDRQLEQLEKELQALAATISPARALKPRARERAAKPDRKPVQRAPRTKVAPAARGLAAAAGAESKPVSAAVAPPRGPAPAPLVKPLPTGADLSDPPQFGLLPDRSRLEGGGMDRTALRQRLTADIKWAQQILHTSGVIAPVWREWRTYEQSAIARLRSLE